MTADRNKGITQIRYNHLNLPIQILFANGSSIMYHYNAIGIKFYKFVQNTSTSTFFDVQYIGGFQYQNAKLNFIHIPQGYVNVLKPTAMPENRVYDYIYQYKDHLEDGALKNSPVDCFSERARRRAGSLSFAYDRDRQEIRTLTEHNYYPFGLEHSYLQTRRRPELVDELFIGEINLNGDTSRYSRMVQVDDVRYQYKYNGKEFQDELGLNEYDYGARGYMPDIVRWRQIDPLAEMYSEMSPYSFVRANPIQNLEVDGRWWFSKSSNNNTIKNGPNKVKISGASQYAFKMSSVRSVHKKQTGVASYIPVISNWLNGSAMAQKVEDPTMKLDKGDVASLALGAYFKGTRKLIGAAGLYKGGAKAALKVSEEFTTLAQNINSSPELKESWVELAVMEHFAGATSEGGNSIGTLRGTKETDYTTIFSFSEDFIGELQNNYGNEFDSLDDASGMNRDTFIDSKVQGHLQNMFESKKSEIMNLLEEK